MKIANSISKPLTNNSLGNSFAILMSYAKSFYRKTKRVFTKWLPKTKYW